MKMKGDNLIDICIEVTEDGIRRTVVAADDDTEQTAAHMLLARIAPEVRALDLAIKCHQNEAARRHQADKAFNVLITGNHWFVSRSDTGELRSSFFQTQAKPMTPDCASEVVRALSLMGYHSATIYESVVTGREIETEFRKAWNVLEPTPLIEDAPEVPTAR